MHPRARLRVDELVRLRGTLTNTELSRRSGVDRSLLANAEAGRKQFGLVNALLLADYFEVHVEDLVELIDEHGRSFHVRTAVPT